MSDLFIIENYSSTSEKFKEAIKRLNRQELESCFKLRAVSSNAEKCCKIYALLYQKRHRKAQR